MQTEHPCGNYNFDTPYWKQSQYNASKPPNDHAYGEESWQLIRDWITSGVNSYNAWNMVLDTVGKSLDGWPQDALLVVDRSAKTLTATAAYYAFRHFSAYVVPGATRIGTTGTTDAVAFKNPDGSVIVEVYNKASAATTMTVGVGSALSQTPRTSSACPPTAGRPSGPRPDVKRVDAASFSPSSPAPPPASVSASLNSSPPPGHDLILVARRRDRLESLAARLRDAHGGAGRGAGRRSRRRRRASTRWRPAPRARRWRCSINNAGFGGYRRFVEVDPKVADELLSVHVRAVVQVTRAALPGMLARGRGGVISVASLLALSGAAPAGAPLPQRVVYAARQGFPADVHAGARRGAGRHAGAGVGLPARPGEDRVSRGPGHRHQQDAAAHAAPRTSPAPRWPGWPKVRSSASRVWKTPAPLAADRGRPARRPGGRPQRPDRDPLPGLILPKIGQVPAAALGLLHLVLRLLALDAELDVGHQLEPLGGDRLLALDAQAERLGVVVEAGERRQHPGQHARAVPVPGRGDRLRHLGQRLGVLVVADRGGLLAGRLGLDVAGGQDLGLERQQALAESSAARTRSWASF